MPTRKYLHTARHYIGKVPHLERIRPSDLEDLYDLEFSDRRVVKRTAPRKQGKGFRTGDSDK